MIADRDVVVVVGDTRVVHVVLINGTRGGGEEGRSVFFIQLIPLGEQIRAIKNATCK